MDKRDETKMQKGASHEKMAWVRPELSTLRAGSAEISLGQVDDNGVDFS